MDILYFFKRFVVLIVAVCYFFYNFHLFGYINLLMSKKQSFIKSHILTFVINYAVFILISQLQFYLIINWTIFAVFLVFEIAILYRCPFRMSMFCGIQGAMVGLAINFITRSGAAVLTDLPLLAFDSRLYTSVVSLKRYPISLGFLLAGVAFWWLRRHFSGWADYEENPERPANLTFSLCLVSALFSYLVLNLLTYYVYSNSFIVKLWGMKSGLCVLIGYYIGTNHVYTLARLQKFERQSYLVREELKTWQLQEEELKRAAFSDCLTGCCTRKTGLDAMQKAYDENSPFHIYFVDINNLKPVNDKLGHDAGDRYISAVAYALTGIAKDEDIVCRYGGDEFILMTAEDGGQRFASGMKNLRRTLEELSDTSEYPFRLSVSYGEAYSRECGNLDELLKLADTRMYEAKKRDKQSELAVPAIE